MGIPADLPKSTLIFKFGSIFGSIRDMYVLATPANFPSPRWENCAPMGDSRIARCLQGGGVAVWGGTVSIVNSQIYSNTATYVRTDIRNFPSPQWENAFSTFPFRFSSVLMGAASNYQAGVRAICA